MRRTPNANAPPPASPGVVLSSPPHRDPARLYAKLVRAGRGELELSPEETEAVRRALAPDAPTGT